MRTSFPSDNPIALIRSIESEGIRSIAEHLYFKRIPVTYFGKAWGKATNNWVYFDTVLDLEGLRSKFDLGPHIVEHENFDPKSGTERGFIDLGTGEAVMGKVEPD